MQKWPATGRLISFRDSIALHLSAVYSWRLNGHKVPWGGSIYALLRRDNSCHVGRYWSIPSAQRAAEQKLSKNCTVRQKLRTMSARPKFAEKLCTTISQFSGGRDYVVTNVCGHLFAGGSCCMSIAPAVVADKDQREAVTHRKCQESDWSPPHGNSTERTNSGKRGAVLQIIQLGCWRIDRRLTHCLSLHLQLANSEVWSWYARREY